MNQQPIEILEDDISDIIYDLLCEFNDRQRYLGEMTANINNTWENITIHINNQVFIVTIREIIPVIGER